MLGRFDWIYSYMPTMLDGLVITLGLLAISSIFGFMGAVFVAMARLSSIKLVAKLSLLFTSVIRGTPLLVQIYIFYYGLGPVVSRIPMIRSSWLWPYLRDGFWYVAIALIISVAAYVGEVIRGGLMSVPKGELEAGRAYGLNAWQVFYRIQLPRAIYSLLPTLSGEMVMLLKSTALASVVAVVDLLGAAQLVQADTLIVFPPLISVALVYIVLAYGIEFFFKRLEHKVSVRQRTA